MAKSWAYYNEFNPEAAQWLRELIKLGAIAPGEVDERSIKDVKAEDIQGFTQCHFFAGIGVWSYALRLAGWNDEKPIWTGSCPCQPFSVAGKKEGLKDERHLWPVFFELIRACRPAAIFGEQVGNRLITGKSSGDAMSSLWETREFLSLLKNWQQGYVSPLMQGLPEFGCAKAERGEQNKDRIQSESSCCSSKNASEGAQPSVRLGCGMGSGKTRNGFVSTEWTSVRHDSDSQSGDAIARQKRPGSGLHQGEYTIDPVWSKCGSRGLGRAEIFRGGECDNKASIECIDDLIAEVSCEIEGENGSSWLDALFLDLGRVGYSCGAYTAPASGVGAPHIRQRVYFVADRLAHTCESGPQRQPGNGNHSNESGRINSNEIGSAAESCGSSGMADPNDYKHRGTQHGSDGIPTKEEVGNGQGFSESGQSCGTSSDVCKHGGLADLDSTRREPGDGNDERDRHRNTSSAESRDDRPELPGPTNGFWRNVDWLFCRDGKWRPTESGLFEMADELAADLGYRRINGRHSLDPLIEKSKSQNKKMRLHGYGNAIVAEQAAEFIRAYMSVRSTYHGKA